jgi:hypothetical protein
MDLEKDKNIQPIALALTGASWLFLGLVVGTLGYCPLTDWHFSILNILGETNLPASCIKFLVDRLSGLDIKPSLVDHLTLYSFLTALGFALFGIIDIHYNAIFL